jgi:TolA-binding protein
MIGELSAALGGINAAVQIGKSLVGAHTDVKINQEISKMLDSVLEAKIGLLEASETIGKLQEQLRQSESRIAEMETWEQKSSAYVLGTTQGRATVYVYSGDPAHYACPSCFNLKQIQVLQPIKNFSGSFNCPGCKSSFPVDKRRDPNVPNVHGFS